MSPFTIRPAHRANVPLVIGLPGPSGSGKTYSALLLARGLAGDGKVVVIDTEHGRAQMYADVAAPWSWLDFDAPFSPERYIEALEAAEAQNPAVVVLDSMSHEYEGDGGLFDIQEEYLQSRAGDDQRKRAAMSFSAWNAAKIRHKKLLAHILRMRPHLIVCMRAADKIELIKKDGKLEAIPKRTMTGVEGWEPITERRFPYELSASLLMLPSDPGLPKPIKLPEPLRPLVPLDRRLSVETGQRLAKWATGDKERPMPPAPAGADDGVSSETVDELKLMRAESGVSDAELRAWVVGLGVEDVPAKVTLSVMKRLTKHQAVRLRSALSSAIDARTAEGI
ncbi:MAG: AAA family ATPase [Solirubrobacteraceae bacterium]